MIVNRILEGNNIDTLKTVPDNYVDCCITSPPYYGLRDYGTAQWEGGDPNCDHAPDKRNSRFGRTLTDKSSKQASNAGSGTASERNCKCGAVRVDNQIGLEESPGEYIDKLILVFNEVYRVLKDTGTCWVNIGDSYNGSGKNSGNTQQAPCKQSTNVGSQAKPVKLKELPPKSLIGIPWRFAFAMMEAGWILRQDIIWSKPSPMPEPIKDRFCKSHEYVFLFTKKPKYYFDHNFALEQATGYDGRKVETVDRGVFDQEVWGTPVGQKRERWPQRGYVTKDGKTGLSEQYHGKNIPTNPLRTRRDVWVVASEPSEFGHYAMYPQRLILPCILCGCPENGIVLDPFLGSGTTAVVAIKNLRKYIGCEINPTYIKIAEQRIQKKKGFFVNENKVLRPYNRSSV